jgi:hypothetical protein
LSHEPWACPPPFLCGGGRIEHARRLARKEGGHRRNCGPLLFRTRATVHRCVPARPRTTGQDARSAMQSGPDVRVSLGALSSGAHSARGHRRPRLLVC